MTKAAIASFLTKSAACMGTGAALVLAPAFLNSGMAMAQAPAATGQVQMDPAEYTDYDNAMNKVKTPAAMQAYLDKYPKSAVKASVMQSIMVAYSTSDPAKAIDAADKVLLVMPDNPQAYVIEVAYRMQLAQAMTDLAARQTALDAAGDYATKALTVKKPADMAEADYATLMTKFTPTFYSAIGADAIGKKDNAAAIAAFTSELKAVPVEQTQAVGAPLQDTYFLGTAYYGSTPPDLVSCTFYTTRAAAYAPEPFKSQFQPLATYCYKKYHGGADGYDAVVTAAKANLFMPADFKIVAAPTNEDIIKKTIAETPDLATLAVDDKEFIMANGKTEDAEKVFATIKGKTTEIPGAVVVKASAEQLQVSVGQEAVQGKVADFSYNMKEPLKVIPVVGSKVTLVGTYSSYTQSPLMIIMSDAEIAGAKKAPVKAPVRKAPVRKR